MNFFKKLFSGKKEEPQKANDNHDRTSFDGIATIEYFNKRYKEEKIDSDMLDGALKMIESYFIDNKITRKVKEPINHPINLDQTVDDGFGFSLYCKAFNLEDTHALMFLALSFNDFMIKNYGFKLYNDSEPEFPLRTMTLKYDNEGAKLSLYPIEYASKVLAYESSFEELHKRVASVLKSMPTAHQVINKLKGEQE
ncbi:hypothetical protein M0G43_13110 [Subsaxibacter sp. CAU 1640]|uniref:hypothetical protein n=1 Tax=Subsaxibacter sp. CAU 1640 TaxID=2933271 RepID=UPI0020029F6F|nr:hypothetical protein [Subsaxibacter sp. CAU 1640]MCK7591519.1 hypothetical protein [Subsaxibacter sp. CAU 1640]